MKFIEVSLDAYLKVNEGIIKPNREVVIHPSSGYSITLINCSVCDYSYVFDNEVHTTEGAGVKGIGIADGKEYVDTTFTSTIRIPIEMLVDEGN